MKNYKVKVKGKLKGKEVIMTVPVEMDLLSAVKEEAKSQADYDGLSDVEILSVQNVEPEYVQMSIPFEEPSEKPAEDQQFDEETSSYTSYASVSSQTQTNEEPADCCEESVDCCNEEPASSSYTPYASASSETSYTPYASLSASNTSVSYVPVFTNGYVPYSRKIVPIPNSYSNYDFE